MHDAHGSHDDLVLSWPEQIDRPLPEFLSSVARVVRRFGDRVDSRTTIVGVETEAGRFVVKHAADDEAVGWLESAIRFHAAVSHPSIPPVVHRLRTPQGLAIVQQWAGGEVLVDGFDPSVPARDDPRSAYQRFLGLPVFEAADAIRQTIHAHLAVTGAGFVAVDLYDGCLIYDFTRGELSLIDLDMYRPGPFALEADRQYGSSAYMAPEEWRRGATIDERTTVFTLGRLALVLLGCARHGPPERADFRGSDALYEIAVRACAADPAERFQSAAELCRAWTECIRQDHGALSRREAVRVLVVDDEGRALLCQYGDDARGRTWWVPPGGGKEAGESDVAAAQRELCEELDRTDFEIGPCIGTRSGGSVSIQGRRFVQEERYYLCRSTHFEVPPAVIGRGCSEGIRDIRWWTSAELRNQAVDTGPRRLPDLLDQIAAADVPNADCDLGW
jgi:8-oxo-dGTP pyrophosphatase MutT (NUDIX family)